MQLKNPGSLIMAVALGVMSLNVGASEAPTLQAISSAAGQIDASAGGFSLFLGESAVARIAAGTWSSFWALGGGLIGLSLVARRVRS